MKKVRLDRLLSELGQLPQVFVCSASFESRCLSVPHALQAQKTHFRSIICYSSREGAAGLNLEVLKAALSSEAIIELKVGDPLLTAARLAQSIGECVREGLCDLLIDTTTFTHEQLLVLVRFLSFVGERSDTPLRVRVAYTGAKAYSCNSKDDVWLSRGVREIRPVVGFSGLFQVGRTTQLILLVGFEHERARALIEHIEPGFLVLARGTRAGSISEELAETNRIFCERLECFLASVSYALSDVSMCEFSVVDPEGAAHLIGSVASPNEHNVIVCPMNTKVSTLGAALAGLADPRIQLMYVEPVEYNEVGYSEPDDYVRIGELHLPK